MRAFLALLLLAGTALPQAGRAYVTELGRRVLANSDQVVEARVEKVLPSFRGVTTVRLGVKESLSGFDRSKTLLVLFIEDYHAPDAFTATLDKATIRYERQRKAGLAKYLDDLANFRVPRAENKATGAKRTNQERQEAAGTRPQAGVGIRLAEGEEGVFFLKRKGASYSLVGNIGVRDPLYKAKRDRLAAVLRVEAVPGFDVRAKRAKELFFRGVASPNPWARGNSARELAALAVRFPKLFTRAEGERLARVLFKEDEPPIRASLERAVAAVDPEAAVAYAVQAEAAASERHADALEKEQARVAATRMPELRAAELVRIARTYGRASTALLAGFLEDEEAIVRERAAQALAEQGGPSANEALRKALEAETDVDAAMALVYACGVRADRGAVDLVAARLRDKRLERASVHALARIGTPAARRALEAHRARTDDDTRDLIASLLREEFSSGS